jgi:hypothetical protein
MPCVLVLPPGTPLAVVVPPLGHTPTEAGTVSGRPSGLPLQPQFAVDYSVLSPVPFLTARAGTGVEGPDLTDADAPPPGVPGADGSGSMPRAAPWAWSPREWGLRVGSGDSEHDGGGGEGEREGPDDDDDNDDIGVRGAARGPGDWSLEFHPLQALQASFTMTVSAAAGPEDAAEAFTEWRPLTVVTS